MLSVCIPYSNQSEYRLQWNYIFNNWSIDKIYFIGENIYPESNEWALHFAVRNKTLEFISSYSKILEPLIVVSPKEAKYLPGETSLSTYTHPNDCCYCFGNNDGFLQIDTDTTIQNKIYIDTVGELFSWTSAGIVLYDRVTKNGN